MRRSRRGGRRGRPVRFGPVSLRRATLAPDVNRTRDRVLPWALLAAGLAVAGVVASVWRPLAPVAVPPVTDLDDFAPAVLETVVAYRGPRYLAVAAGTVLSVLVPFLFLATRRGRSLVERLAGPRLHGGGRAALIAAVLVGAASLARLPLAVAVDLVRDRDWGFAAGSVATWVWAWAVTVGGRVLAYAAGAALLLWAVRRWPRSWPFRLTVIGTLVGAALVLLHPLLIQPLTLRTVPLEPGPVRTELQAVLDRAGEDDLDILVGDASRRTTRVNAFVTGLGPSRQLVLYDNLLELPTDRVSYVVAHELAHRQHGDLARGVTLGAAGLLAGLLGLALVLRSPGTAAVVGARGPTDPRLVPLVVVLAVLGQLLAAPVATAVSRRAEAAADQRALELTQDPAAMVATTRTFVVRDLSDPHPPGWVRALFGTHPSPAERVRAAVAFAAGRDLELPPVDAFRGAEAAVRHPRIGAVR